MINNIQKYIDDKFLDIQSTKEIIELKYRLFVNSTEKYNDQIKKGKSEQEAYNYVISEIGDIKELINNAKETEPLPFISDKDKKKRALITTVAVMIYVLSPVLLIVPIVLYSKKILGLTLFLLAVSIATGMLVYNFLTKPNDNKSKDTITSKKENSSYKTLKSGFWGLVLAIYLLVSFALGAWAYSWIIFIVATAVFDIIKGFIQLRDNKNK